jgi:hypothetical protein
MIVLPEHGRHLYHNNNNLDSYGRGGIDHGDGDDGDRDIWMLALGPDINPGVFEPTNVPQDGGRPTTRYESIDVIMTAMNLLGHADAMKAGLEEHGARAGILIDEVLR